MWNYMTRVRVLPCVMPPLLGDLPINNHQHTPCFVRITTKRSFNLPDTFWKCSSHVVFTTSATRRPFGNACPSDVPKNRPHPVVPRGGLRGWRGSIETWEQDFFVLHLTSDAKSQDLGSTMFNSSPKKHARLLRGCKILILLGLYDQELGFYLHL